MHRNQLYHTAAGFLGKLATLLNAWALAENPIPIPQWYIIVRCKFYTVLVDLISQTARRHDTVKWNVDNVSNIDTCSSHDLLRYRPDSRRRSHVHQSPRLLTSV